MPRKKKSSIIITDAATTTTETDELIHPREPLLQYKISEGRWVSKEEAIQIVTGGAPATNSEIELLLSAFQHTRHSAFCLCPDCAGRAPAFRI